MFRGFEFRGSGVLRFGFGVRFRGGGSEARRLGRFGACKAFLGFKVEL